MHTSPVRLQMRCGLRRSQTRVARVCLGEDEDQGRVHGPPTRLSSTGALPGHQAPRLGRTEPEEPDFCQLTEPELTRGGWLGQGPTSHGGDTDAGCQRVNAHSACRPVWAARSRRLPPCAPELGLTGPRRGSPAGRGHLSGSPRSVSTRGNAAETRVAFMFVFVPFHVFLMFSTVSIHYLGF